MSLHFNGVQSTLGEADSEGDADLEGAVLGLDDGAADLEGNKLGFDDNDGWSEGD